MGGEGCVAHIASNILLLISSSLVPYVFLLFIFQQNFPWRWTDMVKYVYKTNFVCLGCVATSLFWLVNNNTSFMYKRNTVGILAPVRIGLKLWLSLNTRLAEYGDHRICITLLNYHYITLLCVVSFPFYLGLGVIKHAFS